METPTTNGDVGGRFCGFGVGGLRNGPSQIVGWSKTPGSNLKMMLTQEDTNGYVCKHENDRLIDIFGAHASFEG